uniref:Uncharacterized protein n=1 Tax=Anguilla anguilla TaxID=7936 RepID=A0A0E9V6T3_ANGAN
MPVCLRKRYTRPRAGYTRCQSPVEDLSVMFRFAV